MDEQRICIIPPLLFTLTNVANGTALPILLAARVPTHGAKELNLE